MLKTILFASTIAFFAFFLGKQVAKEQHQLPPYRSIKFGLSQTHLSAQTSFPSSSSSQALQSSQLLVMWTTPIWISDVRHFGISDLSSFNRNLAETILAHYNEIVKANPELTTSGHSERTANQVFYQWQADGGEKAFRKQPDFEMLIKIFHRAAQEALNSVGKSDLWNFAPEIFFWATCHQNLTTHLPHSHPNELISGVYYVKVPKNAGDIIFEDPRGPLPPFDNRYVISPKEGTLVLFPSWLIHSVAPTTDNEERISIPFNFHGNWESTSEISLTNVWNIRQNAFVPLNDMI